jgi:hypothetical protein
MIIPGQEVLGHGFDTGFSGHEHVHLPGEEEQAADLVEFFGDYGAGVFLQPRVHPVAFDFHGEVQGQ